MLFYQLVQLPDPLVQLLDHHVRLPDPLMQVETKQLLKLLLTIYKQTRTVAQKLQHILKTNLVEMTRSSCLSFENTFKTYI